MGKRGENIRKRKDGRWEARVIAEYDPEGKARYHSIYAKTYTQVKAKKNRYMLEMMQVKKTEKPRAEMDLTFEQLMRKWLATRREDVKESTYAHYTNLLNNHILPELGGCFLSRLSAESIDGFLKDMLHTGRVDGNGGLSSKTVADIRSVLMMGLEFAQRQGYPCLVNTKIFAPKVRKNAKKILTHEEQEQLERYLFGHMDTLALGILIALYGGLRIGELCALKWEDIRPETGIVNVCKTMIRIQNLGENAVSHSKTRILISSPKTESSNRFVPLPSFFSPILKQYQGKNEEFVLTGRADSMEPRRYLEKYKQILKHAGLESFTFHTLRHTFATRCVESGFDAKSLSEILGHANVTTTMQNYVHPSFEIKRQQMERLQQLSGVKNRVSQT